MWTHLTLTITKIHTQAQHRKNGENQDQEKNNPSHIVEPSRINKLSLMTNTGGQSTVGWYTWSVEIKSASQESYKQQN